MTESKYIPPKYGEAGFNCPNCSMYSHQDWTEILSTGLRSQLKSGLQRKSPVIANGIHVNNYHIENEGAISKCYQCNKPAYWIKGILVYPRISQVPSSNPDMPENVKKIYEEAREISSLSPRASAALLRLALEKLLPQVGAKEAKIDKMIGELVGNGIPKEVEKALDGMRVIGNEAVHPGTIDIQDNPDIASALFKLLNFIVDRMITQKKDIEEIYDLIPESKLQGITDRNKNAVKE